MKVWIYKWLPILCGCHCRPERTLYYKGKPFPVCARCTGELVGMVLAVLVRPFWTPHWGVCALLLLPLVVDGGVQLVTRYESTNPRRVLTGLLFGYGLMCIVLITLTVTGRAGFELGRSFVQK